MVNPWNLIAIMEGTQCHVFFGVRETDLSENCFVGFVSILSVISVNHMQPETLKQPLLMFGFSSRYQKNRF